MNFLRWFLSKGYKSYAIAILFALFFDGIYVKNFWELLDPEEVPLWAFIATTAIIIYINVFLFLHMKGTYKRSMR